MPRNLTNVNLGFYLGFSRFFTATIVDQWRAKFDDRPVTLEDLFDRYDPDFVYHLYRAAGADSLRYERSYLRRRARVIKWLDYFAETKRPLPTHDGNDDFRLVRVALDEANVTGFLEPSSSTDDLDHHHPYAYRLAAIPPDDLIRTATAESVPAAA